MADGGPAKPHIGQFERIMLNPDQGVREGVSDSTGSSSSRVVSRLGSV